MDYAKSIIKSRKLKLFFWIIFLVLSVPSFFYLTLFGESNLFLILILIGGTGVIVIAYLTSKFYSWPLVSFLIVMVGLFFKKQHYPMAGMLITLGTLFLSLISLFNSIRFLVTFRNNNFLKWTGFINGIIVTLFMTGLVFAFQHWGGFIREYFSYAGCLLFAITVFAIVFTLPNSNFVVWSSGERKVFSMAVLTPMILIFGLITLIFVFPEAFNSIFPSGRPPLPWYDNYGIELHNLQGIPVI